MINYDLKIIGCKGMIPSVNDFIDQINDFVEKYDIKIQVMDARVVFGKDHLISAFEHAKRAFYQNTASTHSFEMELLLYAAGERQIKHAISKMGLKKKNNSFVIIFLITEHDYKSINIIIDKFLDNFHLERDDLVIEPDETMLSKFGIKKEAIKSVRKDQKFQLILEKVALVDIIK
jgi:KEOPS complex subunit Cgi121